VQTPQINDELTINEDPYVIVARKSKLFAAGVDELARTPNSKVVGSIAIV